MRDWLESKHWYWLTLTFDFTPFPWHWQREHTNYGWGHRFLFGPFGMMIIYPDARSTRQIKEKKENVSAQRRKWLKDR